ncbi:MAG: hypothetical protein OEV78_12915 [Spirochaetia bacterium]|nr:hypothetical protein [Spirochaetia bacterium]
MKLEKLVFKKDNGQTVELSSVEAHKLYSDLHRLFCGDKYQYTAPVVTENPTWYWPIETTPATSSGTISISKKI